jgi:small subunit ribosomal protein S17
MTETTETRNQRKQLEGIVISDKMDKTIVVQVKDLVQHPLYRRIIKRTSKFKAHDETNDCHVGDKVRIMETRKLSKDKNWRVIEVLERAK